MTMSPYTFEDDPFGGDDGDTDNSLAWADALEDEYWEALAAIDPRPLTHCPFCREGLQDDPPDPETGIMRGYVYCDNPDCHWPGQGYA